MWHHRLLTQHSETDATDCSVICHRHPPKASFLALPLMSSSFPLRWLASFLHTLCLASTSPVYLLQLGLPVASLVLYLGLRIQHPQLLPSEQCRVIGKIFWQFLPGQGSQSNLLGLSEWPHPTHWEPERVRCCFRLSSFDNQAPHFVSEVTEI